MSAQAELIALSDAWIDAELQQDKTALERHAAELVLRHAPGEEELARNLLVPRAR